MILRPDYFNILRTYRDVQLVKILSGIRRCGKSTILEMLREELMASGVLQFSKVYKEALYVAQSQNEYQKLRDVFVSCQEQLNMKLLFLKETIDYINNHKIEM